MPKQVVRKDPPRVDDRNGAAAAANKHKTRGSHAMVSGIEDDVENCVNPAKGGPDPEPVRPPQRVLPAPRT